MPSWAPRVVAFMLAAMAFQGVLLGEDLLERFPDPTVTPEDEEGTASVSVFGVELFSVDVPNIVATAFNFAVWPFAFGAWMFDLTTLGPLADVFPEVLTWMLVPVRLFLGATMLFVVIAIGARIVDAIGQVAPFT